MSEFFPIIFAFVFMAIVALVTSMMLKRLNPGWWELVWVRWISYLIPTFGGISIVLWVSGMLLSSGVLIGIGASGAAITVVVQFAMMCSLPVSAFTQYIVKKIGRKIVKNIEPDPHRRLILKTAAGIFPAAAISGGLTGVVQSFSPAQMPRIIMKYPNLPPALEGFKILQISDIHLGYYVILSDLEKILANVESMKPDMVLVTGDVADDLTALPYALEMISRLNPPYGIYACPGNHEYYRGISEVIKDFNNSPIPLLINQGATINVSDQALLYVAGMDDPRYLSRFNMKILEKFVQESMIQAPASAFRILMSHRPQAYDAAAEMGVELTLSGHTHGGQIGFAGRSAFEEFMPYKYLWGHYKKENGSQLYTTAGLGHWFPFRLGCPPEAPVIVLERG